MDLIGTLNDIEAQLDVLLAAEWSKRTTLADAAVADAALPVLARVLDKVKVVDGDILASQRFSTAPYAAGHKSQASYLAVVSGSSVKQAQRRCRVSKSLRTMQHARAALVAGKISFCHFEALVANARPLRRKAEFEQDEEALVAVAAGLGVTEFKDHMVRWAARVDPDGADALDQARRDDEQLHASETRPNTVRARSTRPCWRPPPTAGLEPWW